MSWEVIIKAREECEICLSEGPFLKEKVNGKLHRQCTVCAHTKDITDEALNYYLNNYGRERY